MWVYPILARQFAAGMCQEVLMVSGISGGSNWDLNIQSEELGRAQKTQQLDELNQEEALKGLEEQRQLEASKTPSDEDWAKITDEFKSRNVEFQFDPNEAPYQLQLDNAGKLVDNDINFNISASLTRDLYNMVVDSVAELAKAAMTNDEAIKSADVASRQKDQDFAAEWQKAVVDEALKATSDTIRELATQDLAKDERLKSAAPRPLPKVEESQNTQSARALRIDDPRQRFANIMPINRPQEPRPVTKTDKSAEAQKAPKDFSLSADLRTRMMLGNQRLAAAGAGVGAEKPVPPANKSTATSQTTRNQSNRPLQNSSAASSASQANNEARLPLNLAEKCSARFASFMAEAATYGFSMDINGLIQFVIREAYLQGLEDIVYVRDKVQYNIAAKKVLRAALNDARSEETRVKTKAAEDLRAVYAKHDEDIAAEHARVGDARWNGANISDDEIDEIINNYYNYNNSTGQYRAKQYGVDPSDYDSIEEVRAAFRASPALIEEKGTYEAAYKSAHPYDPPADKAEQWLDDKANSYLEGFNALVLDQSQDPPQMVKSQNTTIKTTKDLEDHIKSMEETLASLGDDAQLLNTDLQSVMQKQQEFINMLSNVSKLLSNTALAVIRKIG